MTLVDTWAWLALAHKHDPYHALATQQHRLLHKRRARYVTTDYVLAELMGPLFGLMSFAKAYPAYGTSGFTTVRPAAGAM